MQCAWIILKPLLPLWKKLSTTKSVLAAKNVGDHWSIDLEALVQKKTANCAPVQLHYHQSCPFCTTVKIWWNMESRFEHSRFSTNDRKVSFYPFLFNPSCEKYKTLRFGQLSDFFCLLYFYLKCNFGICACWCSRVSLSSLHHPHPARYKRPEGLNLSVSGI